MISPMSKAVRFSGRTMAHWRFGCGPGKAERETPESGDGCFLRGGATPRKSTVSLDIFQGWAEVLRFIHRVQFSHGILAILAY